MSKNVFVAGATGVIGRTLCKMLVQDGWKVTGTTRSQAKVDLLHELGVTPVVVDVFNAEALQEAMVKAEPEIVVHQLTDLPQALEPALMAEALVRNARLRDVGTANLVAAAVASGANRMIAQSLGFVYAAGSMPYREEDPLLLDVPAYLETVQAVLSLERQVLGAPLAGIVLRYGKLYGPGTGFDAAPEGSPLHVDDAAQAARLAMSCGEPGIYNITEDDGTASISKAVAALGWRPGFRVA